MPPPVCPGAARAARLRVVLRVMVMAAGACGADSGPPGAVARADELRVTWVGARTFPGSEPAPVPGRDTTVPALRGLSGLAWLGADRWVAVMDNDDRLVTFRVELAPDGLPLTIDDVATRRLATRHDYEDVVVCPPALAALLDARRRPSGDTSLLVCEEDTPAIRLVALADGRELGRLPLPAILARRRPNRGLEALAVDPDTACVWTCSEEGLDGDSPEPTVMAGTVVRLLAIEPAATPVRRRQYAYPVDPPHASLRMAAGPVLSGVVALVSLGGGTLLVLERSAVPGVPPFESRLYRVDTATAADVAGIEGPIAARPELFLTKRLLWSGTPGCNIEGLALGPPLGDGGTALLAIADNDGLAAPAQVAGLRLAHQPVTSP